MATEIHTEIDGEVVEIKRIDSNESPDENSKLLRDVNEILSWVRFIGWVTLIGILIGILAFLRLF